MYLSVCLSVDEEGPLVQDCCLMMWDEEIAPAIPGHTDDDDDVPRPETPYPNRGKIHMSQSPSLLEPEQIERSEDPGQMDKWTGSNLLRSRQNPK